MNKHTKKACGCAAEASDWPDTWNGRSMKAVSLTSGAETDGSGAALFDKPSTPLSLSPKLAVDATALSKIDLSDAIQILKSIASTPKMDALLSLGDTDVELVGILKGDVDGSWGA